MWVLYHLLNSKYVHLPKQMLYCVSSSVSACYYLLNTISCRTIIVKEENAFCFPKSSCCAFFMCSRHKNAHDTKLQLKVILHCLRSDV